MRTKEEWDAWELERFNARPRFDEQTARKLLLEPSPKVTHLISNEDGTFSLFDHIVCEMCDYCYEQGDCRGEFEAIPLPAKLNPYEVVGR